MTNYKNNLPPYAEEQTINEEVINIQQILNQFKQPVPDKFIELKSKIEEGNYQFSTDLKWKDKVPCERYGFYYLEGNQEKWVQIDIPHTLLENFEIEKGEDITYPLYLSPKVLKKEDIRGAKTIENKDEEEIFIDKPVSEKGAERQLFKRLKELEELREKVKKLEQKDQTHQKRIEVLTRERDTYKNERDSRPNITLQQYQTLNAQLSLWTTTFPNETANQIQTRIGSLNSQITQKNTQITNLITQINNLNNQLNSTRNDLGKWTAKFPNKDSEQILNQLNDLEKKLL